MVLRAVALPTEVVESFGVTAKEWQQLLGDLLGALVRIAFDEAQRGGERVAVAIDGVDPLPDAVVFGCFCTCCQRCNVLPMCGGPELLAQLCWRDAIEQPFLGTANRGGNVVADGDEADAVRRAVQQLQV